MSTIKSVQLPNGDTYNLGGSTLAVGATNKIKKIQLPNGDTYDVGPDLSSITITENGIYTPTSPYEGFSSVEVNVGGGLKPELVMDNLKLPYGSISGTNLTIDESTVRISNTDMNMGEGTIIFDENLIPSNIKKNINIFGIIGDYDIPLNPLNITSLGIFNPPSGEGFNEVTVQDSDCIAANIREGVNILGVTGTLHEGITPSGNLNITDLDSHDVTNYASVKVVDNDIVASNIKQGVNILGVTGTLAAGKNIQYNATVTKTTNKSSYTATSCTITVEKTGNYKCSWMYYAGSSSSATSYGTRLYVGNTTKGSEHTGVYYNGNSGWNVTENSIALNAGDVLTLRAKTRSGSSYFTVCGMLVIEEL